MKRPAQLAVIERTCAGKSDFLQQKLGLEVMILRGAKVIFLLQEATHLHERVRHALLKFGHIGRIGGKLTAQAQTLVVSLTGIGAVLEVFVKFAQIGIDAGQLLAIARNTGKVMSQLSEERERLIM